MGILDGNLKGKISAALRNLDDFARRGGVFQGVGVGETMSGKALCRLCEVCVNHHVTGDFCRRAAISGAYQSFAQGDAHLAKCWLGLHFIVAPIAPVGGEVVGALEVGGIVFPGELQEIQHAMMSKLSSFDAGEKLSSRMNALQGVEEATAQEVSSLSVFLLETLFSCGLLDPGLFVSNREAWGRRNRLTAISAIDDGIPPSEGGARALVLAGRFLEVGDGGADKVSALVDETLANALQAADGGVSDVDACKPFLLPVFSALALDALLRKGASWEASSMSLSKWMDEVSKIDSLEELCRWFGEVCSASLGYGAGEGGGGDDGAREGAASLSERLVSYLSREFKEPLKLALVAKRLGVSSSTLMHKVKDETGATFTELLTGVRVKEAKRLLAFTSLPIGEVATRCGFKDQSYFSKVFFKEVNIKPRDFRKALAEMTP